MCAGEGGGCQKSKKYGTGRDKNGEKFDKMIIENYPRPYLALIYEAKLSEVLEED
jgi:hypothetical protein